MEENSARSVPPSPSAAAEASLRRSYSRTAAVGGQCSPSSARGKKESILQKFRGLVERTKWQTGLAKGFGGAFFAVHHGQHERDHPAGIAHGFDRLERRAARGGDVLDDHHALALQAFALRQSLDREPRAVLLRLLAHEERRDRMTLDP